MDSSVIQMQDRRFKFIGCEIVYREACYLAAMCPHRVDVEFLRKGLHNLETADMVDALQRAIDVIDPSGPRIVATIPLGLAAPALEAVDVDVSGQIGWIYFLIGICKIIQIGHLRMDHLRTVEKGRFTAENNKTPRFQFGEQITITAEPYTA